MFSPFSLLIFLMLFSGMSRSKIDALLSKHQREVERLETKQKHSQEQQKQHIEVLQFTVYTKYTHHLFMRQK